MKYIDEYRDARIARALVADITRRVTRPWALMEICGSQTHALMRYGIDELLAEKVELLHGPGCPVCVTPLETIDKAIALASRPGVILASHEEMLRVPGSRSDLFRVRASGGDVRVVYSPMEGIKIARAHPECKVVFFAIGFETTAPAHAMAVWQAQREGLSNFSMLIAHALVPPAMRLLLGSPQRRAQGFIAPGHVCTVVGYREYEALAQEFRVPIAVAGFEPIDLLEAIAMLVAQLEEGRAEVENQYARSVSYEGNVPAQHLMNQVFEVCDRQWRGLGSIAKSGLRLRAEFAAWDADKIFDLGEGSAEEPGECLGTQVIQGLTKPIACPAFAARCTPEHPLSAPMVSAEGACAAYYHYRRQAAG